MSWPQTAHRFFGQRDIGAMTDDGHHGEGEYDQRNVTVLAAKTFTPIGLDSTR